MPAPLSKDLRARVVILLEAGYSVADIAERLIIADASVRNIYKRFKEDDTLEAKKMGGSRIPKIIQKVGEEFIDQQIQNHPDITCKELQTMYIDQFNQAVSEETIRRCVKNLGYVKKKPCIRSPKVKDPKVVQKIIEFENKQQDFDFSSLMFLDETGLSTSLHQSKVYAKKGMPAPIIHRHIRGASRSIIGVITTDGKSSYSVMKKALNKGSFEEFIRNYIIPLATKPYTLIMDNLSIHKNKACLELLKKHQIEVIFQPPYSPEYNPIEFVWGWVKKSLRRGIERNIDDLVQQFMNKIKQTNINLIKSFALKSGYIDNTISSKLD